MVLPTTPGATRRLGLFVIVAAVLWHLIVVLSPPRVPPPKDTEGRDFASYYYAAKVAAQGGDPYDRDVLGSMATAEGTRAEVHPYFYPPPFLWLVAWSPIVDLHQAFGLWFLLNEMALLAACVALARWWGPFSDTVAPLLAALVALMYGVAYSAELGQANFPVLALIVLALASERRRPELAGVLLGIAAMWKMSPALFVAWWLVRGRWRAAGAAVATAIGSSLLTLPLLDFWHQLEFYTRILPRFGSGDYNGLTIQIGMFANHSVPNLLHQAFPAPDNRLSTFGRLGSTLFTVGLLAVGGWLFRVRTDDPVKIAAQACSVLIAMLLIPVYTYEHHLVFALPAMLMAVVAVQRGWLDRRWAVPIGIAVAILLYDQPAVRQFDLRVVTERNGRAFLLVQEAKFLAMCLVGAAVTWLGATAADDPTRAPVPRPAQQGS
ncbi:MAG: DUF2029 domain-containing protein [Alphaproteobacteria bacterium]|nr:DUF2029 domain-containing protein [Alphaproteobacteria bacterium]